MNIFGNCAERMTDMKKLPIVALDTCCFIDWLRNTPERAEEVSAVVDILTEMHRGEKNVVISAAVIAEIFPSRHKGEARYGEYCRLLRGSRLTVLPMDIAVADTVAHLREELGLTGKGKGMDAIHLGTAIHARAGCLYTLDGGLLKLNERLSDITKSKPVEGFKIRIPSRDSLI